MKDVYIVAAVRTPIGDFNGELASKSVVDLGCVVTEEVIKRAGIDKCCIQEVVAGMIYKAGQKGNPARQIQIRCQLPASGYACTIDQQCGSGMRAMEAISEKIMLGKTDVGIAIGMESMSNAAYVLNNVRNLRMGDTTLSDSITLDGLNCAICNYHMGVTAENLAEKYDISRQEQDKLALLSHERALKAQQEGKFQEEIVPVEIKDRKGTITSVDKDEHPKKTTMETLARLKTVFKKDGTVTAGNASGINDGAAALVLMSEEAVKKYNVKPIAKIKGIASVGVEPQFMGIGPVFAIPKALEYAKLTMNDIGYFEINEAFAAQFLACNKELKLNMEKVNANGSGIALGHPVGATGVRIIVSLIYEAKRRNVKYGVASLCVGGGPGIASVIEIM
ncbi:thiolase family protein [Sporomusa sp. KB1]|uniref:thiolase family protein n=1 Tax=Sporomusa sp. KB1 TaxID=943346 RepID=UPI0011A14B64|nr:thiolase family protein [Sporomusa sp. KB1]TWH45513.1 acetyl-CoA C-acetyltransferase [Sporomusa sp. KB1]